MCLFLGNYLICLATYVRLKIIIIHTILLMHGSVLHWGWKEGILNITSIFHNKNSNAYNQPI